jgi:hypothetical protein
MPKSKKKPQPSSPTDEWEEATKTAFDAIQTLINIQDKFNEEFEEMTDEQEKSAYGQSVQTLLEINLEEAQDIISDASQITLPEPESDGDGNQKELET